MKRRSAAPRKALNLAVQIASLAASLVGIFFLGWILFEVGKRGAKAIDFGFFTNLPGPPGSDGGVASAILGTLLITFLATCIGVPTGIMAGVYLAEFGKRTRLGSAVRFVINIMIGVPSIIVGLFAYTIIVLQTGHFSGYAGAVALAIIMLPVVSRTTEEMLALVPNTLREAALAVGAPRWRVTLGIVFRAAKSGMLTGVLLAVARVSGETAPLLFTALNSPYWPTSLSGPTSNLTVTIFNYAMSPYRDWQQTAWGASLLIMAAVLSLTILARTALKEKKR